MYELTIMLSVFLIVYLSCWWIGDGNEELPKYQATDRPLHQRAPRLQIQEQAGSGD